MSGKEKGLYKKLSVPIVVVECYLLFTVLLYAFGPWDWRTRNPVFLYSVVFAFQAALAWGYRGGVRKRVQSGVVARQAKTTGRTSVSSGLLRVLVVLNLLFITLNTVRTLNLPSLSFDRLLSNVAEGFANPAARYAESKSRAAELGGSLLTYANVLLAPLLWSAIPLSIFRMKDLSLVYKIVAILAIVLESLRWIAIGTNKGLIDILIIAFSIICIRILSGSRDVENWPRRMKLPVEKFRIIVIAAVLFSLGLYFFNHFVSDRVGSEWGSLEISSGHTPVRHDSLLMRVCPSWFETTMIFASSYLTQGYYALSLTSVVDWTPMFGVGNSMFLMANLSSIFHVDLYQYTYQTKMARYGWDPSSNWHSLYVWVANDVGVIGVVIVMYALGRLFGHIAVDSLVCRDDIAVVLFCLLMMLFFYIPANNQVLSFPATFMAFWILLGVWALAKRKSRLSVRPSRL